MTNSNNCNAQQLLLYHYQELDPQQSEQLRVHLDQCPTCRTRLQEIKASLAATPKQELELSAKQKQQFVSRVVDSSYSRGRKHLPLWGGALTAAGAFILAIVLFNPTQQTIPKQPNEGALADLEVLEQFELLQDFDLLQDLELLEELEDLG